MFNQLESGIKELVEDFIADGKPCPSTFDISSRRAGYLASTSLSGSSPKLFEEFIDELITSDQFFGEGSTTSLLSLARK